MASSTWIDGSLVLASAASNENLILSGEWAATYDWSADRVAASVEPRRLVGVEFPTPFDGDLDGALPGQGPQYGSYLYLFHGGEYLRLDRLTMQPNQAARDVAGPWSLPPSWSNLDAVFPGGGIKSGFAYFLRGDVYCRYDWATDRVSADYPKLIGREFHLSPPFTSDFDGAIVGRGSWSSKLYLFKTLATAVDGDGNEVPAGTSGSVLVRAPAYARYDFDRKATEFVVTDPAKVVANWNGLFPILDSGRAIEFALVWCGQALAALAARAAGQSNPALDAAFGHHFMTATPTPAQLQRISGLMASVQARLADLPNGFGWTPGLAVAAETVAGARTSIGDRFSLVHGPNGRAAILIHEAVHFVLPVTSTIDVPEWSGETVNGVQWPVDQRSGRRYSSLRPDEAIENPSSYAAFAQEIAFGSDTRFGGGRPHE